MRLLSSLLLAIVRSHEVESHWDPVSQTVQHHSVETADEVLGDDIVFSPCRAEVYRRRGLNITDDLVFDGIGDDPSCIEEADGQVALTRRPTSMRLVGTSLVALTMTGKRPSG